MSRRAFIAIGLCWLALVAALIGFKEYTVRTGTEVLLRTVPVDPRDLFRGDYVILRYELSSLDLAALETDILDPEPANVVPPGSTVYTALERRGEHAVATGVYTRPPPGLFLQATVRRAGPGRRLEVNYGIESFFVPEGRGREIETQRAEGLDVRVVVDRFGNAVVRALVIDGREWSPREGVQG